MLPSLPSINDVWFVSAHAPFLMEPDTRRQYLLGANGTRFYYVDVPELTQYGDRVNSVTGDLLRLGYRVVCSLPKAEPYLGTYDFQGDGTAVFRDVTEAEIEYAYEHDLNPGESIREYARGQHDAIVPLTSPGSLDERLYDDTDMQKRFPRLHAYLDWESVCMRLAEEDPYEDSLLIWRELEQRWVPVDATDAEYALMVLPETLDAFPSELPYARPAPSMQIDEPLHFL